MEQDSTVQRAQKPIVVDAQFHHIPQAIFKKVDETVFTTPEGRVLQEMNRDPKNLARRSTHLLQDLDNTLRHMDDCGIDVAMIQMPNWSVAGMEVCRVLNDGLAAAARLNPRRFLPLATVPYVFGRDSLDELVRVKNELGFTGVAIMTSQQGVRLDDDRLKAYFAKAAELDLPLVVHPSTHEKDLWGGTKYHMAGGISREYEIIKCFTEVLNGVLPEFPELSFVFAHYGGGVPSLLGRIMSWYSPPESAGLPQVELEHPLTIREFQDLGMKPAFDKLFDRCYFDMAGTGGWMPVVHHALSVIKPERLAFGSDYPYEMGRTQDARAYLAGIASLPIPAADKAKILGANMLSLFNFQT